VIAKGVGGVILMTSDSMTAAGVEAESVTSTDAEYVPADWAAPVIAPYASRLRPVGRDPDTTDHE
jgi:hypothetical protein